MDRKPLDPWGLVFAALYTAGAFALKAWGWELIPFHLVDVFLVGVALAAYLFSWLPAVLLFCSAVLLSNFVYPGLPGSVSVRTPAGLVPFSIYAAANLVVIVGFGRLHHKLAEGKRAERALQESERRFRGFFEATLEGIAIHEQGVVLDANPALAAMFGYDVPELIGSDALEVLVAPESRDLARQNILAGVEELYEITGVRKDGSRLPLEICGKVIARGEHTIRVVAVRDLTERKNLEDRLRQTQKMEAVARLAGGVAHDFNNLLTVITGYAHMLADTLPAGHPQTCAGEILKAAERAARLSSQLLAFSRRQMLQPKTMDLNAVVEDLRPALLSLAGSRIELHTDLDPRLGPVKADPAQVEQVIMNLARNACDAMPGGGCLAIRTSGVEIAPGPPGQTLPPGPYVVLSVSDTGSGMDAETRSHLFEPFFTTKPRGKGTGLSLATSYGIIRQHGGEIQVESESGRGSTFHVRLPRSDESLPGPSPAAQARGITPDLRGTETIVLAEDQEALRKMVCAVLRDLGYTVIDAADGRQALESCARFEDHIDLLVTDVVMPLMSGRELADRLNQTRPGLKVLYISGYTDNVAMEREAGSCAAFLQKPFAPEDLCRKIRQLLDRP